MTTTNPEDLTREASARLTAAHIALDAVIAAAANTAATAPVHGFLLDAIDDAQARVNQAQGLLDVAVEDPRAYFWITRVHPLHKAAGR